MSPQRASSADGNSPAPFRDRVRIPSTAEEIEALEGTLMAELDRLGYDPSAAFAVRLAFQEAANNARIHGNEQDPKKMITLAFDLDVNRASIDIEDEGEGFDPDSVPDPTREENLEIPAGRGLTLIRAFMTDAQIIPPGNRIRMSYERR